MEETGAIVLAKSEKKSKKWIILVAWLVVAALAAGAIVTFIIDYSNYKKGQQFAITTTLLAQEMAGSSAIISKYDPYEEQCKDAYNMFSRYYSDVTIGGYKIDNSGVRKALNSLKSSIADVMKTGGYTRYTAGNIEKWFKYTNFYSYFMGEYWNNILCILFYVSVIAAIVLTIIISGKAKKELIVYEDSVLCKVNSKKSKQLVFEDINNVDFGKSNLTLNGTRFKFSISDLKNVEELKSVILEKKAPQKADAPVPEIAPAPASDVEQLKQFKELLDSGIITQEEFDAKKKQILG